MVRREPAVAVTFFPSGSTKYDAVARQLWRQGSDVRDEGTFLLGRDCPTVLDRREGRREGVERVGWNVARAALLEGSSSGGTATPAHCRS